MNIPMVNLMDLKSPDLKEKYESLLVGYLENKEQSKLVQAYQLGRQVISEGLGMLEIAEVHHQTLYRFLSNGISDERKRQIINDAMEFFLEYFSSYEMVIRSFKEINYSLKQRTLELENANKELEAFSYSVSHDLRSPLRAIDNFLKILLEDYTARLDDEGKRLMNVVMDNTKRMGQLINDLLSFSHLSRIEIVKAEVNMKETVKIVFKELKPATGQRNIKLIIKSLPNAYCEPAMIRQVLINLLSNAIKFTMPKDFAIIEVGYKKGKNECVYYIKDNGVGFDMQYANKLFGVFQRLHGDNEFEGTGIGLAIVQCIIHKHGGRVWAQGKAGEGAAFYFSLPNP